MSQGGSERPVLAITMGDPAGIGPEIIAKALRLERIWRACVPLVLGDPVVMEKARSQVPEAPRIRLVDGVPWGPVEREILVLPSTGEDLTDVATGRLDPRCGRAQVDFIRRGIAMALEGSVHALVTCPINKKGLSLAKVDQPGHTELLAESTGAGEVAMMLAGEHLRVVPVSRHVSLREAVSSLSEDGIQRVVGLTHRALRDWFGLPSPVLAVSGLNPHASDGGLFGWEEQRIIEPAVTACRDAGIDVRGPFSPDAVFLQAVAGGFDAVIAMYHDQGLIPLKLLDRDNAVNITLGLPIIRTSVDHGTAYDIAGQGKASEASLVAAVELAAALASRRAA